MGCCFPFPCGRKKCNEPKVQDEAIYTEYLSVLRQEDPTVGINGISWYDTMYPNLSAHKSRLIDRFNTHYQLREISRPDVNQWMLLLQDRFDEVADRYNHAYKLYDDDANLIDDLGIGYIREIWYNNSGTGSSTSQNTGSGSSKFRDTPTSSNATINNPTSENVDSSSSNGSSSSVRNGQGYSKEEYDYNDEHKMNEINDLINKYKQLDEEFIGEFNQMFIGVLSEWC